MKFILWTLVWFGLSELSDVLAYGFPYAVKQKELYSDSVIATASLIVFVIWIVVGLWLENKKD